MELFLKSFLSIFSIINPFGTIPIFLILTQHHTKASILKISIRTAIYVLIVLIISFFIGNYLLDFFGISIHSLKIGGGIIVAISGFSLLTGSFIKHKGVKKSHLKEELESNSEIALTPLAIPMLAGPGTISTLITFSDSYSDFVTRTSIVIAVVLVCICIFLILYFSRTISKLLGSNGLNALSRIIGFILISIGVELILTTLVKIVRFDLSIS